MWNGKGNESKNRASFTSLYITQSVPAVGFPNSDM